MKSLRFSAYGLPSVLTLEDLPTPQPAAGEVLVRVAASAINPSDVKNVAGSFHTALPRVPGRDYAGVVVGGAGQVGIEVWGSGPGFGVLRDGAHAEFIVMPAEWVAEKPRGMSMAAAGSVGVAYLAAWCALVEAAKIAAGETVVIVGVTGAVGQAATQIANWKKARVLGAATNSTPMAGVEAVIDTKTQDLAAEVRKLTGGKGADVVLDGVGGAMFEPSLKALRVGGRQVVITSGKDRRVSFDLIDFYHNELTLLGVDTMKLSGPEIARIMNELKVGFEAGALAAPEVKTWPLEQAVQAYEVVAKGGATAKQVLIPGAAK